MYFSSAAQTSSGKRNELRAATGADFQTIIHGSFAFAALENELARKRHPSLLLEEPYHLGSRIEDKGN
jgi:hypothetical protein